MNGRPSGTPGTTAKRQSLSPRFPNVDLEPFYEDPDHGVRLYQGDSLRILRAFPEGCVDLIFADPPYSLSNGGITCHAGRMVSVDKGDWDKAPGIEAVHSFNREWLSACQRVLASDGTIWVSGTTHVIFSIGHALQELGFKILNDITWFKTNAPPNLSCRYFTHSTEHIIWAAKSSRSKHKFNYALMKQMKDGKQMRDVWTMSAPGKGEKLHGKHPTQKPLALLERIIVASSHEGDLVLDPFVGSGTTAVAAVRTGRRSIGIELELEYLSLARARLEVAVKQGSLI